MLDMMIRYSLVVGGERDQEGVVIDAAMPLDARLQGFQLLVMRPDGTLTTIPATCAQVQLKPAAG